MTRPAPGLAPSILLYAAARLGVVAVVAGVLLVAGVPLLLAVLIGLIVALPLSMFVFRGLRDRLDSALVVAGARRSEERAALRARLRGEHPDTEGPDTEGPDTDAPDHDGPYPAVPDLDAPLLADTDLDGGPFVGSEDGRQSQPDGGQDRPAQ